MHSSGGKSAVRIQIKPVSLDIFTHERKDNMIKIMLISDMDKFIEKNIEKNITYICEIFYILIDICRGKRIINLICLVKVNKKFKIVVF